MWEWFKRQARNLIDFFASFWQTTPETEVNSAFKPVPISTLLGNKKDPIHELKDKAFTSSEHARMLLQRNDLKEHLNYNELCDLINKHRKHLEIPFIQNSLNRNHISFLDLAQYSASNALILLKSRFLNVFKANELADIYYTHRHDKTFLSALIEPRAADTQYPNARYLPPLSYILKEAYKERIFEAVCGIISKSVTLLLILSKEFGYGQPKRQQHHHRIPDVEFPAKDPYAVLELPRDATEAEVKKAYRKKAVLVHPDKGQSVAGNRFKEVNEAYKFLIDPEKRKAWDNAYPMEHVTPLVHKR